MDNERESTHFISWMSQLYYYIITSLPVSDELENHHQLDWKYWKQFYMMGLSPRESVKVYSGWIG